MSALPIITEITDQGITAQIEGVDRDGIVLSALKGTLTPKVLAKLKSKKPELLRSLKELQERAAQDWEKISKSPEKLKALAELIMIDDMRKQGITPDHYTSETDCKHCGTVPIFEGCPPQVDGCPWCFNRLAELSMPNKTENEDCR